MDTEQLPPIVLAIVSCYMMAWGAAGLVNNVPWYQAGTGFAGFVLGCLAFYWFVMESV